MGKTRDSYGSTTVKGAYDGSIRGIENNKTIGMRIERTKVVDFITYLTKYLESGNKNPVDVTIFKNNLRLTVTAKKQGKGEIEHEYKRFVIRTISKHSVT